MSSQSGMVHINQSIVANCTEENITNRNELVKDN